jgi:hypothetical protein
LIGMSICAHIFCLADYFCNDFGKIFLFVIPTHSIDNINPKIYSSNLALAWDFLSRIFSSYFIFQTIFAFRKYIR